MKTKEDRLARVMCRIDSKICGVHRYGCLMIDPSLIHITYEAIEATIEELESEFTEKAKQYEIKLFKQYKDCEKHYVDVRKIKERRKMLRRKREVEYGYNSKDLDSVDKINKQLLTMQIDELTNILLSYRECA